MTTAPTHVATMHLVATAGHVDHGKSTLLRTLTGMEPDRWDEERRRGLTIDLGFVWTDLPTRRGPATVAFVDVPGHERFLPNMLAGVGAATAALFVVAADDGWSAQSEEHHQVLDLLEVPVLLAVVTKADVAGPARTQEVAADVGRRLGPGMPVVAVDARDDTGVAAVARALADVLVDRPAAAAGPRARLWVDRCFTVAGAGVVVTGTLQHGRLAVGDLVTVLPGGSPARVRGLQCLGRAVDAAAPGTRVAANLAGIARDEVTRGDAIVAGPSPRWPVTDTFEAQVRVLPNEQVRGRGSWMLHVGTAAVEVDVHPVLGEPIRGVGQVRLGARTPLPLRCGDRILLREVGRRRVVAGGVVLVPWDTGRLHGVEARLRRAELLEAIAVADGPDRVAALVAAGVDRPADELLSAADVAAAGAGTFPDLVHVDDRFVLAADLHEWAERVDAHLDRAGPVGADRPTLAGVLGGAGCPTHLTSGVLDHLLATRAVAQAGPALLHPAHQAAYDDTTARRRQALLDRLGADPWAPPPVRDVLPEVGASPRDLQALAADGAVVVHGPMAFTTAAVATAVEALAAVEAAHGPFTAAMAREALGTTRRAVIPLLELLDAAGVTTFDGQRRQVRHPAWPPATHLAGSPLAAPPRGMPDAASSVTVEA